MLKALLIADQQRLHALVAASLGGSGVQLTIISSLASGIEQAVATLPDLLFVQGRLSGLSLEIVSRHVASHVDLARTRLIIFSDPGEDGGSVAQSQLCLDLSLPDSALEDRIASLVKAALPSNGRQPEVPPPDSAADDFIPDRSPRRPKPAADVPAPMVQESSEPVESTPAPPHDSTVATRFEAELDTELARREAETVSVAAFTADEPRGADPRQPRVGQAEAAELATRSRRRIVTAVTILALLLAAAAFTTFYPPSKSTPPPKVPAATKPAPAPSPAKQTAAVQHSAPPSAPTGAPGTSPPAVAVRDPLPSFVPVDGRDPAYPAANPGWERYQDARQEYKVFWERGKLMALQVIDKTGTGLSSTFFTKSMQELAGVRDYRLTSKEVKDNHLVKKGSLGKAGNIIIYKNKADSVLQAFVIHFEQDRNRRR